MFGKIAPETAKKTVAITKLLQESCHTCGHAKGERCFGRVVKAPDLDNDVCKQCITDKEKQIFGEKKKMLMTEYMQEAFWMGSYIAVLFLIGTIAWVLVARLINSSLD